MWWIGSHGYRGWVVLQCLLETQESWWCSSLQPKPLRTRRANGVQQFPVQQGKTRCLSPPIWPRDRRVSLSHHYVLFGPSRGWIRTTQTEECNLLYESTDSNANFIQRHPPRHTEKEWLAKCLETEMIQSSWHKTSPDTPSWIILVCCSVYWASS